MINVDHLWKHSHEDECGKIYLLSYLGHWRYISYHFNYFYFGHFQLWSRYFVLLILLINFILVPIWYEVVIFINIVRYAINHPLQSCTKISNKSCTNVISTGHQIRSSFPTKKFANLRIRKYIFKLLWSDIKYKQYNMKSVTHKKIKWSFNGTDIVKNIYFNVIYVLCIFIWVVYSLCWENWWNLSNLSFVGFGNFRYLMVYEKNALRWKMVF